MTTKIVSYCKDKPETIATLTMDADGLITCDNADFMEQLEQDGIGEKPPGLGVVYPGQGLIFWQSLPFHFTGLLRAVQELD